MSRSYKKTPRCGDYKDKYLKKCANRKVRRLRIDADPPKYNNYKKIFSSWDICDYESVGVSFNDYWKRQVQFWHQYDKKRGTPFPDKKKAYWEWYKYFKRK